MKKFNKISIITILFSIIFFPSCQDGNGSDLINLKLAFNSKAKTNTSRSITPSNEELTVYSFIVEGVGPDSKTFTLETDKESTELSNLVKGKWNISVTGYNVNNEAIVEGSGIYYLFNSQSVVNITLDYIVGNGDIDIDLYWNTNQVDPENTGIITTYYKLENNTFSEYEIIDNISYEAGHANVKTSLPAGNYLLASKLFTGSTELSGFAEEIRVIANHTTTGSNTYVIGDTTLDYGINFTCNTHLPKIGRAHV